MINGFGKGIRMKNNFFKLMLCLMMVMSIVAPVSSKVSANEEFLIIDDSVTSDTEDNYFTYSAGVDVDGATGW